MKVVEASLIMPITIFIIIALISLTMNFYNELGEQIKVHEKNLEKLKAERQVLIIRVYDRISHELEE